MGKNRKNTVNKKENAESILDRAEKKLTVLEMYERQPHKWLLYLGIVLVIAVIIGWSASDIHFSGMTATGTEVAKGVMHGVFHPDTKLMFGTGDSDVPYLLFQTIGVLGILRVVYRL